MYQQTNPDTTVFCPHLLPVTKSFSFIHPLSHKKACKPCISKQSLQLIKQKDALYTRFLRTRDPADLRTFKTFRNKVTSYLRQAKQYYLHNLFNPETLRRSDVLWKKLNTLLGCEQDHTTGTELIHNGMRMSMQELANTFNNFFTSVGDRDYDPCSFEISQLEILKLRF